MSNATLRNWHVLYRDDATSPSLEFQCWADNEEHAIEQARNAYPEADVLGAIETNPSGVLFQGPGDSDNDFTLAPDVTGCWISIGNISVHLVRTDEGVVVDLYPLGAETEDALSSTYAFSAEAAEVLGDIDDLDDMREHVIAIGAQHARAHAAALTLSDDHRAAVFAVITATEEG